jgi:hypothetical protein
MILINSIIDPDHFKDECIFVIKKHSNSRIKHLYLLSQENINIQNNIESHSLILCEKVIFTIQVKDYLLYNKVNSQNVLELPYPILPIHLYQLDDLFKYMKEPIKVVVKLKNTIPLKLSVTYSDETDIETTKSHYYTNYCTISELKGLVYTVHLNTKQIPNLFKINVYFSDLLYSSLKNDSEDIVDLQVSGNFTVFPMTIKYFDKDDKEITDVNPIFRFTSNCTIHYSSGWFTCSF